MWLRSVAVLACLSAGASTACVSAAEAAKEKVLYSFGAGGTNEAVPVAGLIDVGGDLYGTTPYGGNESGGCSEFDGCGTVFSVDKHTGEMTVLHSFAGSPDGIEPMAGVIDFGGTLYGTTYYGGDGCCCCGTVYSLNLATGAESVVHSFSDIPDGSLPEAPLVAVGSKLYGTTVDGGHGCGTVFSIDPSTGNETVVYSFQYYTGDGCEPKAGLIGYRGSLYGTTYNGGAYSWGTVFSIDLKTGVETVLHSFSMKGDGYQCVAGLVELGGLLYGTTEVGGTYDHGIVFSVNPKTGAELIQHSFAGSSQDGGFPAAPLIDVDGELYGTTLEGGSAGCSSAVRGAGQDDGCGTVFKFAPYGTEKVIYNFCIQDLCADGTAPNAPLVRKLHGLYGTTEAGGAYSGGTVFRISR
jgi:uncharacterized repeat protein (TIGR03803 family)